MVNAPVTAKQPPSWWKEGVNLYQIYPSSYKDDRNGDGVGDLRGIINKLDYIKSLGVDGIWLCPHYKSPRIDEGYDVSDYNDIHEPFGTMDDCLELIEAVHARGMKVLFDLVINHCSDQHDWFKESRSSKENPKRDWFIWRPPRMVDGVRHPPNNWRACFGGSVWEWDELTQEYYLHYFVPEQPDFNWENPEVRSALFDKAIKFWLDRGVDGFRIDTVNMYSKYLDFPDAKVVAPDTPWQPAGHYFSNGPRLREFLREMRKEAFSKYDCFTIGECPNTPSLDKILEYVSTDSEALDCTILFDLMDTDHGGTTKYPLMAQGVEALRVQAPHRLRPTARRPRAQGARPQLPREPRSGSLGQPLRIGRPRAPSCVVQAPLDLPPHALGLDHHLPGPGDRHDQRAQGLGHRRGVPRRQHDQHVEGAQGRRRGDQRPGPPRARAGGHPAHGARPCAHADAVGQHRARRLLQGPRAGQEALVPRHGLVRRGPQRRGAGRRRQEHAQLLPLDAALAQAARRRLRHGPLQAARPGRRGDGRLHQGGARRLAHGPRRAQLYGRQAAVHRPRRARGQGLEPAPVDARQGRRQPRARGVRGAHLPLLDHRPSPPSPLTFSLSRSRPAL